MDEQEEEHVPSFELHSLKVLSALGRGAKGIVFLVHVPSSNQTFALKVISKAAIEKNKSSNGDSKHDGSEYRRVCLEQEVLRSFRHPLLPRLRGVLDTEKIIGYAIDYCPGRDLNSLRKRQSEKMFSDDIIRFYAAELVLALEYLHGLGIIYRDLKPENIMIQENGHLMLVDFDLSAKLPAKSFDRRPIAQSFARSGSAKKPLSPFHRWCKSGTSQGDSASSSETSVGSSLSESDSSGKSNSFVGTEEYVAPEIILAGGHDFAVDWWCLGVVLYEMLYGTTPFRGSNRKETFYRILTKPPELVGEPTALRDLISKLLEKDPTKRISVERIKGHDFFRGLDWDLVYSINRPPFIPARSENEDKDGITGIDVELYVQGLFDKDNTDSTYNQKIDHDDNNNNVKRVWAEGLNHHSDTDNFVIF